MSRDGDQIEQGQFEQVQFELGHSEERHTETDARTWGEVLGPGLVTGAADDDPSGIGTYSQVGAQFGFSLETPWDALPGEVKVVILHGTAGRPVPADRRR